MRAWTVDIRPTPREHQPTCRDRQDPKQAVRAGGRAPGNRPIDGRRDRLVVRPEQRRKQGVQSLGKFARTGVAQEGGSERRRPPFDVARGQTQEPGRRPSQRVKCRFDTDQDIVAGWGQARTEPHEAPRHLGRPGSVAGLERDHQLRQDRAGDAQDPDWIVGDVLTQQTAESSGGYAASRDRSRGSRPPVPARCGGVGGIG
jgi:hypothetical protein